MKPLSLRARNLRTWRELELELPDGITAIVGPNGAGKSSLVQIIDLALFGSGRELKRALTRGGPEDTVALELTFEHAGEVYRVRRSYQVKGAGKPRLDLELADAFRGSEGQHGWIPQTRETIAETQADLEALLGLSRQTFRASSYLAQGDGAAFTQADPRDRKAILLDALGVRVWDQLKESATELRRREEGELAKRLADVERIEGELAHRDGARAAFAGAELHREPIAGAIEDLERALVEKRGELEDALATAADRAARSERLAAARRRVEEDALERQRLLARLNGDDELDADYLRVLAAIEPAATRLVELRSERRQAGTEQQRIDELGDQLERQEEALSRRVDELVAQLAHVDEEVARVVAGEAVCPTCEQEIAGAAREKTLEALRGRRNALEDEQASTLNRAREADERLRGLRTEGLTQLETTQRLAGEWADLYGRLPSTFGRDERAPDLALAAAQGAARDLAGLAEREKARDDTRAELGRVNKRHDDHAREIADAEAGLAELQGADAGVLRATIVDVEARIAQRRRDLAEADRDLERARVRLERLDGLELELADQRPLLERGKEHAATFKLAEQAFGRDGVPALILEAHALPQLEAEANRVIGQLGRSYRFELRTQRETQAGAVKEALDVVVATESGEAFYEDFSGGERTRLDLALRIALARLIAARRGADVRVLVIDEPAFLDAAGFEQLAAVLRDLTEFEAVLVVSHEEALRDAFDTAIVVAGGGDTDEPSRLEGGNE